MPYYSVWSKDFYKNSRHWHVTEKELDTLITNEPSIINIIIHCDQHVLVR